jgi:hypothetical protein
LGLPLFFGTADKRFDDGYEQTDNQGDDDGANKGIYGIAGILLWFSHLSYFYKNI